MPLEFPASVPFAPAAHQEFLSAIQGNILKPHGRTHVRLVFFAGLASRQQAGELIAEALATKRVTSAWEQREQTERWKAGQASFFYSLALTKEFFWAAARNDFPPEAGGAFLAGAYDRATEPWKWDRPYRDHPQGVWLVAHGDDAEAPSEEAEVNAEVGQVEQMLQRHGARILRRVKKSPATEAGFRWHDAGDRNALREPFGFRDGLSDSVFYLPDQPAPNHVQIGLDRLLIPTGPHAGGSFFVLQKLDQNVAAFRQFERALAGKFTELKKPLPVRDAGALLVGRERDGTPLATGAGAASNDFDFDGDAAGARCPFHAHIRKANPRTTTLPAEGLLQRQFARRSTVYDEREQLPKSAAPDYPDGDAISGNVGLLFMGYMQDVQSQFEHMRRTWFESPSFPFGSTAMPDPVMAAGLAAKGEWHWPQAGVTAPGLPDTVRNRGTLFGYVPSLPWLEAFARVGKP